MHNDEVKKACVTCGKKLQARCAFDTCYAHRTPEQKRAAWNATKAKTRGRDQEDSVLDRMGFGALAKKSLPPAGDEAPPATKVKKPRRAKPPREVQIYPVENLPKWQAAFRSLTSALGLDPDGMLESYCRDWVETTRARALPPPVAPPQLMAGVVEVRPDTGTGG